MTPQHADMPQGCADRNSVQCCRVILLVVFLFVMTMVLLNLLIAIMSDAAAKVRQFSMSPFLMHVIRSVIPGRMLADTCLLIAITSDAAVRVRTHLCPNLHRW